MSKLTTIIKTLDGFTESVGRVCACFSVLMVLVTCYIVISRYMFNAGSVAVQESVIYLNVILVFFTAAYTLKHNGHVRVDIFYSAASPRYKAWINLLGALLLLMPTAVFILLGSWDYVMASWRIREESGDPGGLPYVYLLKSSILLLCVLLLVQGLVEFLRNLSFLLNRDAAAPVPEEENRAL